MRYNDSQINVSGLAGREITEEKQEFIQREASLITD